MALKSTTVALVLIAGVLGGVVYFTQAKGGSDPSSAEQKGQTELFNFEEKQVKALSLKTPLRSLSFEKADSGWQMTAPDKQAANDASIAYLLNLLATGKSDRVLTVPSGDREQFGFHQPFADVSVTLDNGETHRLILGEYDFNRQFIYGQIDPPETAGDTMQVVLVSPDFENGVSRPLDEWKQAEPSPSESPSDTPSPDASESPDAPDASSDADTSSSPDMSPQPSDSPSASPDAASP